VARRVSGLFCDQPRAAPLAMWPKCRRTRSPGGCGLAFPCVMSSGAPEDEIALTVDASAPSSQSSFGTAPPFGPRCSCPSTNLWRRSAGRKRASGCHRLVRPRAG
jgi:hypothetical protein